MKLKDIFNNQINEAPEAGIDSTDDGDNQFTAIEEKPVSEITHYIKLGDFVIVTRTGNRTANHTVHLYRMPTEFKYVFGIIEDDIFYELGLITLEPQGNFLGYKNVYEIGEVKVANDVRQNGLSTTLYRYLVLKLNMNLLCGGIQFVGARKLWSKISRQPDMAVDVVNKCTQKIIKTNEILNHGQKDTDYNTTYWGVNRGDNDFACIRFIMRPK
jgi:hypothetical protein